MPTATSSLRLGRSDGKELATLPAGTRAKGMRAEGGGGGGRGGVAVGAGGGGGGKLLSLSLPLVVGWQDRLRSTQQIHDGKCPARKMNISQQDKQAVDDGS